jgi:hypothetical protein
MFYNDRNTVVLLVAFLLDREIIDVRTTLPPELAQSFAELGIVQLGILVSYTSMK